LVEAKKSIYALWAKKMKKAKRKIQCANLACWISRSPPFDRCAGKRKNRCNEQNISRAWQERKYLRDIHVILLCPHSKGASSLFGNFLSNGILVFFKRNVSSVICFSFEKDGKSACGFADPTGQFGPLDLEMRFLYFFRIRCAFSTFFHF